MPEFKNSQIQTQAQSQVQVQSLSPQQVLEAKLLELSTIEIEDRVRAELDDNPALEEGFEDTIHENDEPDYGDETLETNPHDDFLSEDDEPDFYTDSRKSPAKEMLEIPYSESESFYDVLNEQLAERELTDIQKKIAAYLIGSLNNDGFLDKSLQSISDDLAFYQYLDVTTEQILEVLKIIQDFEPAGIGARNLQESLLIQLDRKDCKGIERAIIADCFDEFTHKHWEKIATKLLVPQEDVDKAIEEIQKLNPRPGNSLGESISKGQQQIIPDFIIERNEDELELTLNNFNIPELRISSSFASMLDAQINSENSTQRNTALYIKQKIDAAKGFIQALKQRERTMYSVMHAIIGFQQDFFIDGDETRLRPMILKDIAEKTGYDISTVSRTTNGKYVQTNFGILPLKFFFIDGVKTESGEEVSVKEIHRIIKEKIESEDKGNPFTDEQLSLYLKENGYIVARRTVAKYREQLEIPIARLRKN